MVHYLRYLRRWHLVATERRCAVGAGFAIACMCTASQVLCGIQSALQGVLLSGSLQKWSESRERRG